MKPFLKWVGGKTQLLSVLMEDFPDDATRYAEPFIGGGALFFHVLETRSDQIEKWYISDLNPVLINLYRILTDPEETEALISELKLAQSNYNRWGAAQREKFFYDTRTDFNKKINDPPQEGYARTRHSAQAIFLNKTSFNGLWRVTKKGHYNTPFNFMGIDKKTGECRPARICKEKNLLEINRKLSSIDIDIRLADFAKASLDFCLADEPSKTFFYFDPPYRPVNKNSFKAYTNSEFNDDKQVALSRLARNLVQRGSHVLISNSKCEDEFFRVIYPSYFNIETISARRSVNSNGQDRKGFEVLISDYRTVK